MSEVTDEPTPGSGIFGPSVDAFDERVDQLLEIVRSSKTAGRVFLAASRLGDFSVVWHLIAVSRAMTGRKRASQALAIAAIPEQIRGFGHVKAASVEKARARLIELQPPLSSREPSLAPRAA